MRKRTRSISIIGAAVVASTALAACGGGSSGGSGGSSNNAGATSNAKGGTLYELYNRPLNHMDPQRMYTGLEIINASRLYSRSLVQYPVTTDPKKASTPVPDMATNTGTMSDGGKTWKFTLKDGIKWQDGSPVTCADLKYGVSRSFATDIITGGPNYILGYLDIPEYKSGKKKGLPMYDGPYKNDGKKYFDKAITCSGKTITYHFKKPWIDFNQAVASLRSFDAYKKSKDQGNKSNMSVFSDGPYKLQGTFSAAQGGTFVRNPEYDPKTDGVRKALPDKIVFQGGVTPEISTGRLVADAGNDKDAVTSNQIPPSKFSQITGAVAQRTENPQSPYTEFLQPNFARLKNPKVREALAVALDKSAYIAAGGGPKLYDPAYDVASPTITGFKKNPAFASIPDSGDPAKAKKILKSAGVKLPYPIKLTYPGGTPTADKEFAAIAAGWNKAGFKVTLNGLTDTYYNVAQNPSGDSDVYWGSWGADWPSMSTVLPPLFDSRVNLQPGTNGQDYGRYKSDKVNNLFDQAAKASSPEAAAKLYQQADAVMGKDYAYIPIAYDKFYLPHGSNVTNYINNPAASMYPDLGGIGVKH